MSTPWEHLGHTMGGSKVTQLAAAAKEGDQSTAALPYHFVFYLHQAHAQQQTLQPPEPRAPAAHTEPVADGLHKISLTLPPPARKDYAQPDQLPVATQASIGRLLSACGLQRYASVAARLQNGHECFMLFHAALYHASLAQELATGTAVAMCACMTVNGCWSWPAMHANVACNSDVASCLPST